MLSALRLDLEIRYLGVYDKEEWAVKAVDFTFVKSAATFQGRTRSRSLLEYNGILVHSLPVFLFTARAKGGERTT